MSRKDEYYLQRASICCIRSNTPGFSGFLPLLCDQLFFTDAELQPPLPSHHGKRLAPSEQSRRADFSPQQRLLILDPWIRSDLPARDFAPLIILSRHTLYAWKQRFDQLGPVPEANWSGCVVSTSG